MKTIKYRVFLPLLSAILFFFSEGCFSRWSEEERREFKERCFNTDTTHLVFLTDGFHPEEIDTILVRHIKAGTVADSFYVFVGKSETGYIQSPMYNPINIKGSYEFIIQGEAPYVLSDMKMVMWSQNTMFSEGFGCVMGDYKIDGVRFEHSANPKFIKRGVKNSSGTVDSAATTVKPQR